jgi:4'-phosphopantetheinyl transferase
MPPWPARGEVHVWSVALNRSEKEIGALGGMLTADELLRAGGFKSLDSRRRFLVSRAALRALLGGYLGAEPAELAFAASATGKPRLDRASPLRFNLSHSGRIALIAVAAGAEVGVDVERVRARESLAGIARRVFSEAEREAVYAAGAGERDLAFFRHWVAKEAFVKATGRGIGSLRSFEVVLEAPGGARLVHVGGDAEEAARWTLEPLDMPSGYAAAVVAEGSAASIGAPRRFDPAAVL